MPELNRFLRYILLFFIIYGVAVYLLSNQWASAAVHSFYKDTSVAFSSLLLSKADIQSQFSSTKGSDAFEKFVVRVSADQDEINRRIAEARKQGLSEISNPVCDIPFKAFEFYTVPLVFVLSLIMVTPMSIRRKIWSAGLGALAMLLYLWIKFLIQILFSINVIYPLGMYELGGAGLGFVTFMSQAMTMGLSIMVGVVIWLIVSFKSLPLDRLRNILSS